MELDNTVIVVAAFVVSVCLCCSLTKMENRLQLVYSSSALTD
jgi:hypothetical protein